YDVFKAIAAPDSDKMDAFFKTAESAGVTDSAFLQGYLSASQMQGTKDKNGKTITGSHDKNLFAYLQDAKGLSQQGKRALYLMFATTKGNYNDMLFKYLDSLPLAASVKKMYYNDLKRD
ncbi:MAG TPA: hypothetical protein DEA44_16905, partial [Firmicutes bacterium]|nr:hypothetical protein [Bacillota bacterium]